jgi:hypothetical protein
MGGASAKGPVSDIRLTVVVGGICATLADVEGALTKTSC